jgi:DNA-binding XRE family transcriptional regulator
MEISNKDKPDDWATLLKKLREKFGITQNQGAALTWVTVRAWVRWESGKVVPPLYIQRLLLLLFDGMKNRLPSVTITPQFMETSSKAGFDYLTGLEKGLTAHEIIVWRASENSPRR